jgi:hypothetical protein
MFYEPASSKLKPLIWKTRIKCVKFFIKILQPFEASVYMELVIRSKDTQSATFLCQTTKWRLSSCWRPKLNNSPDIPPRARGPTQVLGDSQVVLGKARLE